MNWYITVLKKYTVFTGRSGRSEYWYFVLFSIIVSLILAQFDKAFGNVNPLTGIGFLGTIYSLGVLLPSIGVSIRRLHDIGKSGWWLLIGFVPLIGFIVLIYFFVKESDPGENEYGTAPDVLAS